MYYKLEEGKFVGFYEDKDKDGNYTEITLEDWQMVLDKQSQGEVIFYNPKTKKLETILLGQFEELENGTAVYKKDKEVDYNNNQLTYLRKRHTELKIAKIDSEALGLDTTDIDTEIAELKTKVVSTQLENGRLQKTGNYRISLMKKIRNELYELRLTYDVKPFEFEVKGVTYLQNNRSIDQSNLTRIVVMCQATKKTTFDKWKFYTKDNSEKYVTISLSDMMRMAEIMQEQTTKSMATETLLSHNLENLTEEELKNYNAKERYEKAYREMR